VEADVEVVREGRELSFEVDLDVSFSRKRFRACSSIICLRN